MQIGFFVGNVPPTSCSIADEAAFEIKSQDRQSAGLTVPQSILLRADEVIE